MIATLQLDTIEWKIPNVKKEAYVKFLNGMHQNYQCEFVPNLLFKILYGEWNLFSTCLIFNKVEKGSFYKGNKISRAQENITK